MTDKWYMFTPVDLSQDGEQVYEMVAGNVYVVGTMTVKVAGDEVTVSYDYFNDMIQNKGEFFTIFPDYESITTVEPAEIEAAYEYETVYSIANDLGGDTEVVIFACNVASVRDDNPRIVRFWENTPERKALRENMLDMIGMTKTE